MTERKDCKQYSGNTDVLKLLHTRLVNVMLKLGYKDLTPIQELAIPQVLRCRNVLIIAPTGSGKTEATLFPIISEIIRHGYKPIAALYITPLRALNRDIFNRLIKICDLLGISVDIRHGDTPQSRRKLIDMSPPHIIITTPETLSYILINKRLRPHLRHVRWVIIDEFHELLSSKRGAQLLINIARLERISKYRIHRIALSANVGDMDKIKEYLVPNSAVCEAVISAIRESEVKVVPCIGKDKHEVIADIVKNEGRALIFTNTRDEAEWLGSKLMGKGINLRVHHGSLSKSERIEAERLLKKGEIKAIVATSSLELGIDVGHIPIVIQSSSPRQANKLLQRIGRSMHRFYLKARGVIVTSDSIDDTLESAVIARRTLVGDLEGLTIPIEPLDVLAHAIVGMALEDPERGVSINEIIDIVKNVKHYEYIDLRTVKELVDLLLSFGYLRKLGEHLVATEKGKLYYLKTTMIVDTSQYAVIDVLENRVIGNLDEEFVITSIKEGDSIVLSGKVWKVLSIDDDSKKLLVEPAEFSEALIPTWVGETIPVHYKVAREVCGLRRLVGMGYIPSVYKSILNDEGLKYVTKVINEHLKRGYPLPSDNLVLIEIVRESRPIVIIHSCLGSNGNRGLGIILSYLISSYLGLSPTLSTDPYRVVIQLPVHYEVNYLKNIITKVLNYIKSADMNELLIRSLENTKLFTYALYNVLSRLGIVRPDMPRNIINTLINEFSQHRILRREAINEIKTRYIDVNALEKFMEKLKSGSLIIKYVVADRPSPIGSEGFTLKIYFDRVKVSTLPSNIIKELIKRRILSREVILVCMMCRYSWRAVIGDLPETIRCPKCGYGLITMINPNLRDVNTVKELIIRGMKAGRNYKFVLSNDEKKLFEELMDIAKLVLIYGKKAIIALQARGVGPKTAMRLISETLSSDEEFYLKIYEYERMYARTRKYWR